MRKFYLAFAAAIATVVSATAADAIVIADQPDNLWQCTDMSVCTAESYTGAAKFLTWTNHKPEGCTNSVRLWAGPSGQDSNDWLISPPLTMKGGVKYEVTVNYAQFAVNNVCPLFEGFFSTTAPDDSQATADAVAATTPEFKVENITATAAVVNNKPWPLAESFTVTPATDGDYYVWYHVSGNVTGGFYLANLTVKADEYVFHPAAPTDVKAEFVTEDPTNCVLNLTWTNPTTDTEGNALTAEQTITNVYVYDNGVEVATLEGDASSWSITQAEGLAKGAHSYTVAVKVADVISAQSEAAVIDIVFPVVPLNLPYSINFSEGEGKTAIADGVWARYTGATNMNSAWNQQAVGRIAYIYSGKNSDAWLISPEFVIPQNAEITVGVLGTTSVDVENSYIEVGVVDSTEPAEFIVKLTDSLTLPVGTTAPAEEAIATGKTQLAAGNYRIALHAAAPAGLGNYSTFIFGTSVNAKQSTTSINGIVTEDEVIASEYYTIAGQKVSADNLSTGLYIRKSLTKSGKTITAKVFQK